MFVKLLLCPNVILLSELYTTVVKIIQATNRMCFITINVVLIWILNVKVLSANGKLASSIPWRFYD